MILFRVDGNGKIGTGHVMRCLSIARALRTLREESRFLIAGHEMQGIIEEQGFQVSIVHTEYTQMDTELEQIPLYLEGVNLLLIDSYYITKQYLECVEKKAKVVYLDDLVHLPAPVDYLINYNCYANKKRYADTYTARIHTLFGMDYAPLREEFQSVDYQVRDVCSKILITTGGTDQCNLAVQLLERFVLCQGLDHVEFIVVVGAFHEHKESLERLAAQYKQISLHHQVKNMSQLMAECDIAISATGSTIYELCAVGLPTIALAFVENQDEIASVMGEQHRVLLAGHYHYEGVPVIERTVEYVLHLCTHVEERRRLHHCARSAVDGQGATRIAQALIQWAR
ncbi:MAG: UDP-2,4-diacetamido-2,4,6-trideoxy-beta-L-altropyranose hydrolase [Eubacteriales bacterium]